MRIHRPKLKMPHPLSVLALAMIWPLCAVVLTFATTPSDKYNADSAPKGAVAMQVVEVQADKLWQKVATVPARIRATLHSDNAS
jgi:hypothetical protein